MKRTWTILIQISMITLLLFPSLISAQELIPIQLPEPQMKGGMPLMEALSKRKTSRDFSDKELPLQVLSNILWAANGINRPESGRRTAPTAVNWQEIDVYIALAEGLYLYDAKMNVLQPVLAGDIRAVTGRQNFVKDAPVNLIFVSDYSRMGKAGEEMKDFYSATDTGFISQNVYLYCASEGLATVVRGAIERPAMREVMPLREDQRIMLAQSIGYPRE